MFTIDILLSPYSQAVKAGGMLYVSGSFSFNTLTI